MSHRCTYCIVPCITLRSTYCQPNDIKININMYYYWLIGVEGGICDVVDRNTIHALRWSESDEWCVRWSRMVLNEIARFTKTSIKDRYESFNRLLVLIMILNITFAISYVLHYIYYIVSIHLNSTHIIWAGLDGLGSSKNCHKMRTRNR